MATTDRVFAYVTDKGPVAWRIRTRLLPLVAPLVFRLPGVRRFLFRTVSQVGVNYRHSALSEGKSGSVHGGDRLPWVPTGPGRDNFDLLTTLGWQAHVYGEAPRALGEACKELRLPLHVLSWQAPMRDSGLVRGTLYLIRPDGYLALVDPLADPAGLRSYFSSRGLRTAP